MCTLNADGVQIKCRTRPPQFDEIQESASAVPSELEALAGTLEAMPLAARVTVLKGLDAGRRARVLECFTPTGRIEAMTELLKEVA